MDQEIAIQASPTESRDWSLLGVAALLLVPVLLWLIGAAISLELKPHLNTPASVEIFAHALGAFVLRWGSIALLIMGGYRAFFTRPGPLMPKWMSRPSA